MRKLIFIFLVLLLSSSFVLAEDTFFCINGNEYYDKTIGKFMFLVDGDLNGAKIYSNVADGMITTDSVKISYEKLDSVFIYRDGLDVTEEGLNEISTPGVYLINIKQNNGNISQVFQFTILNYVTGKIDTYTAPSGFAIISASKDGADIYFSNTQVDLKEEGRYKINSLCLMTGIEYTLDIDIDHTAPTLLLSNVQNGVAKGPVDISDLPEKTSIYITLDGNRINYSNVLNVSGVYHIYLLDEAGNSTEYNFTIAVYFNFSSIIFIGVTLGGAIALLVYLLRSRKKLRIR